MSYTPKPGDKFVPDYWRTYYDRQRARARSPKPAEPHTGPTPVTRTPTPIITSSELKSEPAKTINPEPLEPQRSLRLIQQERAPMPGTICTCDQCGSDFESIQAPALLRDRYGGALVCLNCRRTGIDWDIINKNRLEHDRARSTPKANPRLR